MSTSRVLFRVSYGFLAVGGPAATLLLLWLTLPSDEYSGANIGGGALWILALVVLGLGLALGLVAAVVRLLERRAAAPPVSDRLRRGVTASSSL